MDDQAEFRRKARAMFARVKEFHTELAFRYTVDILEHLVTETRGFGNQKPADTDYIPTGRLRGGYSYSLTKLETASKWEEGPFSDYGEETVARIEADMRAGGLRTFYVVNDVAYAWIVWRGRGQHAAVGPDDWLGRVSSSSSQKESLDAALRSMGAA